MNVLLIGYYGHRNIGDDLFVKQLVDFFIGKGAQVSVLCRDDYYKQDYLGKPNVKFHISERLSKFDRLWLILQHQYIFWGGGTLDFSESPASLIRMQRIAKLFRKTFGFLGAGLEGIQSDSPRSVVEFFDRSDVLYLRDLDSYQFAKEHLKSPRCIGLGGDLAFLNLDYYTQFQKSEPNSTIQKISFSGKNWWGNERAEFYAKPLLQLIETYGTQVYLLPGNIGPGSDDNQFHQRLMQYLPESNARICYWDKPGEFLSILGEMDFHIGNRLHSIILADILGVPNIGINSKPPKIRNYIQKTATLVEERSCEFMENISLERIEAVFQQYQRPDAFIQNESLSAADNLMKLL